MKWRQKVRMMKKRQVRILLEKTLGLVNKGEVTGEVIFTTKHKEKFQKIKREYKRLCEEEDKLDEEIGITQEAFMNYKQGV